MPQLQSSSQKTSKFGVIAGIYKWEVIRMSDELWDWILDRIGEPIPCELCGTPTAPADLTECRVPGMLIAEWDIVVDRIGWVCPRCPVVDPTLRTGT
jgi:hypothetical protein